MSSRQPFDLVAAARRSMTERGFTPDYPPQVLQELAALQADPPKTNPAAEDLQHLPWSSIDNDTSRDLDQSEYSEMLPHGHTRVLIGIADVDRYVAKGSAIDQLRGPGNGHHLQWREELLHASGGALDRLTSLLEGEVRAWMVTEFVLDAGVYATASCVCSSRIYRRQCGIALYGLARKTFDSSHLSVVQRIGSSLSTSLS